MVECVILKGKRGYRDCQGEGKEEEVVEGDEEDIQGSGAN